MDWLSAWLLLKEYALLIVLLGCVILAIIIKKVRKHSKPKPNKQVALPKEELREDVFENILQTNTEAEVSLTDQIHETINNLTTQIRAEKELLSKHEQALLNQQQAILQQVKDFKAEWDGINAKLNNIRILQKNNYYLENINTQKNVLGVKR